MHAFFIRKCFEQLFSGYILDMYFLAQKYWRKRCRKNVDEIDTWIKYKQQKVLAGHIKVLGGPHVARGPNIA